MMTSLSLQSALAAFLDSLACREYAPNSIRAYRANISALLDYLAEADAELDKETLIAYKRRLVRRLKPSSANRSIAAVNLFLKYLERPELALKSLRVQEGLHDEHELSPKEFTCLMDAALRHGRYKTAMILLTLAQTGIRIGELRFITAEAVRCGRAVIHQKGKVRAVLLPDSLQTYLSRYCRKAGVDDGPVFLGRTGAPISRSYVAEEMKTLAASCGVNPAKAFPHNLRHYFARRFLSCGNGLTDLADLLGHSRLETTRRYLRASDETRRRQLDKLKILPDHALAEAL